MLANLLIFDLALDYKSKNQDVRELFASASARSTAIIARPSLREPQSALPRSLHYLTSLCRQAMLWRISLVRSVAFCVQRRQIPRSYTKKSVVQLAALQRRDLEENFVKGSGNGGQKINKVRNCVQLRHVPSGITVSCQDSRSLTTNRSIARKLLKKKVGLAIPNKEKQCLD